jgi:hypothetical protein
LVDDFFKRHDGPFACPVASCHHSGSLSYHRRQGGCVSKDAHFFKQLIYMHFCLHETRDTQYRIPYRAIRWSKGSLGFRENRKVQPTLSNSIREKFDKDSRPLSQTSAGF